MSLDGHLAEIVGAWRNASYPVVMTGAGISTESGLPDFRSASGLWKQMPESLATLEALDTSPDDFYFFHQSLIAKVLKVAPNEGHKALAELEALNYLKLIITQNVDGLHQKAGSKKVVEIHGTLSTISCINCHAVFDSARLIPNNPFWEEDYQKGTYRRGEECYCPKCRGLLRPDEVMFGESLPEEAWSEAVWSCQTADFFVVVGSSLQVGPANLCPQWAVEHGSKLLIINNEPTPLDYKATWVLRGQAGIILDTIKTMLSAK